MGTAEDKLKELEEAVHKASKKKRTEMAVLGSISLVGFMGAALLAPNAVQVLQYIVPDTRPLSHKQSVRRAIGRLIEKRYIEKKKGKYHLTQKGKERLDSLLTTTTARQKNAMEKKKWDGKWRIVIFDIKESRRHVRRKLRSLLLETGFVKLQDSVWVYPYRCDEVIALLKFHLKLGWDLVYIIADAIEGDDNLRKHYGLKKR